jgi:hypothetical protein
VETPFDFENHPTFIAIVGSREWPEVKLHWIKKFVNRLKPQTVVVSGEARGVDLYAKVSTNARKNDQQDIYYKPYPVEDFEWELIGKRAGHVRNEILVLYMKLVKGHVVIFALEDVHGNLTSGSANVIMNCVKYHVPYTVYRQPKEGT